MLALFSSTLNAHPPTGLTVVAAPSVFERILLASMLVCGLYEVILEWHAMIIEARVDRSSDAVRLFVVDVRHILWVTRFHLVAGQVDGLMLLEVREEAVPAPLVAARELCPGIVVGLGAADVPGRRSLHVSRTPLISRRLSTATPILHEVIDGRRTAQQLTARHRIALVLSFGLRHRSHQPVITGSARRMNGGMLGQSNQS